MDTFNTSGTGGVSGTSGALPRWLTIQQAADYLQIHPTTVRRAIHKGRLEAAKLGRIYRIRRESLDDWAMWGCDV